MATHTFETIDPPNPVTSLPARISQSSPKARTIVSLAALILTAFLMAAPFAAVAAHLVETPEARQLISVQPGSMLQLVSGLLILTVLLGLPATRLARRLTCRIVILTPGYVAVEETGPTGGTAWRLPTSSFTGLAHHVRASMAGVRHELVLRHDDPSRTVLIAVAPRFTQTDVERMCSLLGVREIPACLLYERRGRNLSALYPVFSSQNA